ncbi:hypothetical protein CUT44_31045 [Streptomyces carminius]|uniref:Uncharacterized protein n=1 Tax=Streptomyces carminius TaxID=2665496 RepID=A0A2M8LPU9_9ACTN|nr:hypothetical protein CUT44_31045 [Streptomyces carminius]
MPGTGTSPGRGGGRAGRRPRAPACPPRGRRGARPRSAPVRPSAGPAGSRARTVRTSGVRSPSSNRWHIPEVHSRGGPSPGNSGAPCVTMLAKCFRAVSWSGPVMC